jgi:hypothetical protein
MNAFAGALDSAGRPGRQVHSAAPSGGERNSKPENAHGNSRSHHLTLFELQEWLGHATPAATQHYAKITPTKLAKSYADAGYFRRNLRAIEVLVDQEVVRSGRAANEPWKFYDLGHGYCTYDFFDQCPHRMACAKCSFYLPKRSSQAQLLEGKTNLVQLRQEIPLSEAEIAAVDDGLAAMESLLAISRCPHSGRSDPARH